MWHQHIGYDIFNENFSNVKKKALSNSIKKYFFDGLLINVLTWMYNKLPNGFDTQLPSNVLNEGPSMPVNVYLTFNLIFKIIVALCRHCDAIIQNSQHVSTIW